METKEEELWCEYTMLNQESMEIRNRINEILEILLDVKAPPPMKLKTVDDAIMHLSFIEEAERLKPQWKIDYLKQRLERLEEEQKLAALGS